MATRTEDRPPIKASRVVAGILFIGLGVSFLLESLGAWSIDPVAVWPMLLIALGTSMLVGRANRAKVEEDRSAQLAVAEERVRIARELHDIVAHGVSLMTIQVAAARRVHKTKPDKADEAMATAEETGRQCLAELRSMLQVLRGADASIDAAAGPVRGSSSPLRPTAPSDLDDDERTPLPGIEDVEKLISDVRNAGLDVTLTVSGEPVAAAGGSALAVYRVVQESLTNAMRHAPGSAVKVELTYTPDEVIIFIDDDGRGAMSAGHGGARHGLLGMRERVSAVGGTVEAGPRSPGPGWRVHARIPLVPVLLG